jgi:hypothetical protein
MSSLIVQMTTDQLKSLVIEALRDVLGGKMNLSAVAVPAKGKRAKKERDPDAPKREPNDWIKFTSHVRSVLATQMEEGKKVAPKAVTQVSSALKEASLMPSASDEQIIAAYKNWLSNPPTVSKMVSEGRDKKSKKSVSSDDSSVKSAATVASAAPPPAEDGKKKGRKPMSEEAKKAAATKRAATKGAATKGAATKGAATKDSKPSKSETTSNAAGSAEDSSDGVMDFEPFTWKKMELLKNARGDVLTSDMEWFGKWDTSANKVDTSATQPADLDL